MDVMEGRLNSFREVANLGQWDCARVNWASVYMLVDLSVQEIQIAVFTNVANC